MLGEAKKQGIEFLVQVSKSGSSAYFTALSAAS